LSSRLNRQYGLDLTPALLFEYATLNNFADYLNENHAVKFAAATSPAASTCPDTDSAPEAIRQALREAVQNLLKLDESDIDFDAEMSEFGFDSISMTELSGKLNREYGLDLTPANLFEHATLGDFADYLHTHHSAQFAPAETAAPQEPTGTAALEVATPVSRFITAPAAATTTPMVNAPIAIIGMAGRLPGSDDLETFWQHLLAGDDLITEIPTERWDWQEIYGDPTREPGKTLAKWGGFINNPDAFDAAFFGIS
ncbi:MAG: hypothetical protein GY722_05420, partial [bacterium]|nr:hypothetical protein [bacterium]